MAGQGGAGAPRIQSLGRTFAVIDRIAADDRGATLADIVAATGLNRTTVWRLVADLRGLGIVHDGQDGRLTLGPHVVSLGAVARRQLLRAPEVSAALLQLRDTTGETCHLAAPDGDHMVYLEKFDSTRPVRAASRVGGHIPLHCTALGKAYLAHVEQPLRESLIQGLDFTGRTPNTITDAERLRTELTQVATRGWALDNEENEESIRCVAAPVLNRRRQAVAAVSVSVPLQRLPMEQVAGLAGTVLTAARRLSEVFGSNEAGDD